MYKMLFKQHFVLTNKKFITKHNRLTIFVYDLDDLLLLYPDIVVKEEAEDLDYSKALPYVLSKFLR